MTEQALEKNPLHTTYLARCLNLAMALDPAARARYAVIYGTEWSSLGDGTMECHTFTDESVLADLVRELATDVL